MCDVISCNEKQARLDLEQYIFQVELLGNVIHTIFTLKQEPNGKFYV